MNPQPLLFDDGVKSRGADDGDQPKTATTRRHLILLDLTRCDVHAASMVELMCTAVDISLGHMDRPD